MLILYPSTLLNLFVSLSSFMVESLELSVDNISFANRQFGCFYFFFLPDCSARTLC